MAGHDNPPPPKEKKRSPKKSLSKKSGEDLVETFPNELPISKPAPKKKKKNVPAETDTGSSPPSAPSGKPPSKKKKKKLDQEKSAPTKSSSTSTKSSSASTKSSSTASTSKNNSQSRKKTAMSQELEIFAPYASLHFNEMNKVTFIEKFIHFIKALKKIGSYFVEAEPTGLLTIISKIVGVFVDVLISWARFCANPLRILVEARDENGKPKAFFLITDKRSSFQRFMRWGQGRQLTLTTLADQDTPILTTNVKKLCCFTRSFEWKGVETGEVMAFRKDCCACSCRCNWLRCKDKVDYIECSNGERMKFYVPRCHCCQNEPSVIEARARKDKGDLYKMAVKRKTSLCASLCGFIYTDLLKDFLDDLEFKDFFEGDLLNLVESGNAAKGFIGDAADLKDAFQSLKDMGLVKIQNTEAKWDLNFQKNQNPYHKHASVLRVLSEYTKSRIS